MLRKFRIGYFAHSLRSDWNNGNAHFLRGLLSAFGKRGNEVIVFEPEEEWSLQNLRMEENGDYSLSQFGAKYGGLRIQTYNSNTLTNRAFWIRVLAEIDVVVLHEWNPPALAISLLALRRELRFKLVFHDTHHRASSSPEQIRALGIDSFDGVIAFGEALALIYRIGFGMDRVWTLHEAADTDIFKPHPEISKAKDVVWIGNWGDDERSDEIRRFILEPASQLRDHYFQIYGVRYPEDGLAALASAGVSYGGYLPNLDAPEAYAAARLTVHVPRQHYVKAMTGIPTIRVFEALACGIPLISAPWQDTEGLFREGDFLKVSDTDEMRNAMEYLLHNPNASEAQVVRGYETVMARHTCRHRAKELTNIFEELLS